MSDKLRIAFFGMMVGGAAFLSSGMAVYLAMAQVQDSAMQVAKLQDRIIQAQGPAQPTGTHDSNLRSDPSVPAGGAVCQTRNVDSRAAVKRRASFDRFVAALLSKS
jgi:hypothetical protein